MILTEKIKNSAAYHKLEKLRDSKIVHKLGPTFDTLRLNRPASALLMVWPMLWGYASADEGALAKIPALILLGLTMRVAYTLYSDLNDPTLEAGEDGAVTGHPSMALLIVLIAFVLLLAWNLGALCLFLTILWGLMAVWYPYLHRFTWHPQIFAGILFGGWATLVGQGVTGGLTIAALFLFPAGILWVAAVETLRADIKRAQDKENGLRSIALALGQLRIPFMSCCLLATLVFLVMCGMILEAGGLYYAFLMGAQLLLGQAYYGIQLDETNAARSTYARTAVAGLLVALSFAVGV